MRHPRTKSGLRMVLLLIALSAASSLHAQKTAAQIALANEPEVRQVNGVADNYGGTQKLPNGDIRKPSQVGMALNGFRALAEQQALLDRLEGRLNSEARACNFCSSKQEELSELIRERVELQEMFAHVSKQTGTAGDRLLTLASAPTRWQDIKFPIKEAEDAIREHCNRMKGSPDDLCKQPDAAIHLAGAHENAWAKCFKENNWVDKPSLRVAYETCLSANDPFTKLCTQERKASPHVQSCPYFTVNYADVDQLHFYHDRWVTDPDRLPATATIISGQPMHVTLLEPVIVPPGSGNAAFTRTVRGRLENSVVGAFDAGLNPSTKDAVVLKPGTSAGLSGHVTLIPAGTEVPVTVQVTPAGAARVSGAKLDLQIVSNNLTVTNSKNHQLISDNISRHVAWPANGTVLIPANSSFGFSTQCGCPYSMSVAEFRKRAASNASSADHPSYSTRPILVNSRLQIVLLDTIDVPGIQAGKRSFHAKLNVDMELPRGITRDDAFKLPRGTDVYLKLVDQDAGPQLGHIARISVNYVVVNGRHVPLATEEWRDSFYLPGQTTQISRRPQPVHIVWAAGQPKWFSVTEQSEVSADGTAP